MTETPVLEFTGERFTPECVREIWYEHMHRYAFAARLAAGRRVLDAACGEGYGTALIGRAAASVVGLDIDAGTMAHAQRRYSGNFVRGSVSRLPFASGSFDLITSFETIEHLAAQQEMLAEFRRVLAADGLLLISSPDKAQYSDATGYRNPDHVRELYRHEFIALLEEQFSHLRLYGQRLQFHSLISAEEAAAEGACHVVCMNQEQQLHAGTGQPALYWIAACSNHPAAVQRLHCDYALFADTGQSIFEHYNYAVRRYLQNEQLLRQRDARIAELEQIPAWIGKAAAVLRTLWRRLVHRGKEPG